MERADRGGRSAGTLPAARESRVGAYLAFAAICVIWGTTFAAIRVAIETGRRCSAGPR